MKDGRRKRETVLRNLRGYLVFLAVLIVLGCTGFIVLRTQLLKNAQNTGTNLAQGYASEMHNKLTVYETLLSFGAESLDQWEKESWDQARRESWLSSYFERVQSVLGYGKVDPYAVLNGSILAANPWEGDDTFAYTDADWYQMAVEAKGSVIFTDVYMDAVYHKPVITVAQQCAVTDAVLAFDIFPENLEFQNNSLSLPKGVAFFLCDRSGTLIYKQTAQSFSDETLQSYVAELLASVQRGEQDDYNSYIKDLNGEQSNVCYGVMPNGWYSIITIPYGAILEGLNQFALVFLLILLLCVVAVVVLFWRDLHLNAQVERTNETVRVLGNSYYALYRVDFEADTYEMIKGSDELRERLPQTGPYASLVYELEQLIEPDACAEFRESFSAESIHKLVEKRVRDFGGDFQRRFGSAYRWVNVRILFDESLAPHEVVLCFREVEQEKQREFQARKLLETALENARRSEKTKHAFFNNMSHDMRTPLNAILGLSELVQQHLEEPEKVSNYVSKINTSSRQLLDLVNDILDMSRMEQGKVILNYEQFDLRECIAECAAPFQLQAEAEKKKLYLTDEMIHTVVLGDPFRISQIMNNLLSNAFKFTKEGDTVSIRVRQFEDKEYAQYQITVQDTGLGMSKEFLPQLFEPYARENRFSSRQISGTGLGMPIVKNLVTQMSGQIHVESALGKGTTFTIVVPFSVVRGEKTQASQETGSVLHDTMLNGKRILLAEDNLVNMEIATEILSMNGVTVVQAWNGEEAVERFKDSQPFEFDAILMDMQMPQMDGCEAARHIRALSRPDAARIPIIAVTANAFAEDISATTAAGMDAHISKPIDFSRLCATLDQLIQERS